ncbi:MAG TPA: hypothetical protein VFE37_29190 [Chloroflexota bacterium]|nr:hypothetical protein [Chloroflexota bacterium]
MVTREGTAPPFPDCWVAYGATNPELDAYGVAPRLAAGLAGGVVLAQLVALVVLGLVAAGGGPLWLRGGAAVAAAAVLGSAVVGGLRLLATARALTPCREHLWLGRALGPVECVPWEQIGEIALVQLPTRQAVGLRLRPGTAARLPAAARALQQRVCSGFDFLLVPADGDCELLGRVLLRYCIDRKARRRLPAGSP